MVWSFCRAIFINNNHKINQSTVKLQISFESLVKAISDLDIEQKQRLWKILNEEMANIEDDLEESNPRIQAEINLARKAYEAGDYTTIEEYKL